MWRRPSEKKEVGRDRPPGEPGPLFSPPRDAYIELFSEFQRASTLVPTEPMTAIAATTIRPAIRAYSSTSPPRSSRNNFDSRLETLVMPLTSARGVGHF